MALLIGVMILFPPYAIRFDGQNKFTIRAGYGFLFDLPVESDHSTIINVTTLATPICGVLLVGGLLYVALKTRQ